MYFEEVRNGSCMSYVIGCERTCAAVVVDPALEQRDRYLALTSARGMRIHYLLDTHTHADHFSGARRLGMDLGVPTVMHRASPAPFVDVRVTLEDGVLIDMAGAKVKTQRRADLKIPDRWPGGQ